METNGGRDDAWAALARECPRRIIAALHRRGEYAHGTAPGRPGKVLCLPRDTAPRPGWRPTPAQAAARGFHAGPEAATGRGVGAAGGGEEACPGEGRESAESVRP